ncbi:MAG: LruC domain-containing protein [Bacteroidota bacterium]
MAFLTTLTHLRSRWALPLLGAGLLFAGCDASDTDAPDTVDGGGIESMQVAPDFDYATTRTASVNVRALTNGDAPLEGVRFDVFDGEKLLGSAFTDAQGRIQADFVTSASTTELTLRTDYVGLASEQVVALDGGEATAQFGGATALDTAGSFAMATSSAFTYISAYDGDGKPADLLDPRDVVTSDFLADVNAALPERQSVIQSNPQYLAEGNELDIVLVDVADVWVTFVHEGAGYKNALGYYVYDTANPPASAAQIAQHYILFPNASFDGSGGKLKSGDKLYLGRFNPGQSIGWFIVQNGWENGAVSETDQRYYSNPAFNPANEQHNVLLNFAQHDRIVLGFDDQPLTSGDQDFNDAVFYVSANPITAVDRSKIATSGAEQDTDGDGVPDILDDEPADPTVATYEYGPAEGQFGTLAYEDLWPSQGDYDFNDLVVDYNVRFGRHANGDLTKLDGQFVVKAIGAGYRNGFALDLPTSASSVASVEGQRLDMGLFTMAANGTESGRANAIVPVFDNANEILSRPGGFFANTQTEAPHVAVEDTVKLALVFGTPVPSAQAQGLSVTWLNPFLVSNQERGREVHLPNLAPSAGADPAMLGSRQDRSDTNAGFTYKNERGLPWALHFADGFVYPTEQTEITTAYTRFQQWAESSGESFADWYTNLGYRVNEHVYDR